MKKEKLLRAAIDCTAHRRSETKTAEHNSKLAENGHAIGTSSGTNSDHSALHAFEYISGFETAGELEQHPSCTRTTSPPETGNR